MTDLTKNHDNETFGEMFQRVSSSLAETDKKAKELMKKTTQKAPETKPAVTIDEVAFTAWMAEKNAEYKAWLKAGETGTMSDDLNPAFMFQGIATELLLKITSGEISAQFLAAKQLVNRGLDKSGKWVGFENAEKIHFPTL